MLLTVVSSAYTTGCLNKGDKAIRHCGFQQCFWVGCLTRESEIQGHRDQEYGHFGLLFFPFSWEKMPEKSINTFSYTLKVLKWM